MNQPQPDIQPAPPTASMNSTAGTTPPLSNLMDLQGKVAVVTGGSRGIGYASAQRLAEAGATVILADIVEPASQAAETEAAIHYRHLDVTDAEACERFAAQVANEFGSLNIWVNSAGVFPLTPLSELSPTEWREVIGTNLDGSFYGARAAAAQMTRDDVIINIASASSFRVAGDGRVHYASSKGGVRSLTQGLARELGPRGIRVLGVAPTATLTEGVTGGNPDVEAGLALYGKSLPLGRIAMPDDIARVVLFAASDLAVIMTGSVIAADAGQLAV